MGTDTADRRSHRLSISAINRHAPASLAKVASTPSRFKHVIQTTSGTIPSLTPVELSASMVSDGWTDTGIRPTAVVSHTYLPLERSPRWGNDHSQRAARTQRTTSARQIASSPRSAEFDIRQPSARSPQSTRIGDWQERSCMAEPLASELKRADGAIHLRPVFQLARREDRNSYINLCLGITPRKTSPAMFSRVNVHGTASA